MGEYLDRIIGVHCECFLVPEYKGIPLFADIFSFLNKNGLKPNRVIKKKKNWIDMLFFRDEVSEDRRFIDNIYSQYRPYTKSLESSLFKTMRRYMDR